MATDADIAAIAERSEERTCYKVRAGGGRKYGIIEKVYKARFSGNVRAKVTWERSVTYEDFYELCVY